MATIVFYDMQEWEQDYVKKHLDGELSFHAESISKDRLPRDTDADVISIFIDSKIDGAVLHALPHLRLVSTRSTGFDHIDLGSCKERGVCVGSVPSYGENTVSEYAFGLILNLSRKISEGHNRLRETGVFSNEGLQGFDLKGKTIGIVGTGRIGAHTLAPAAGFGMRIVCYDPYPNPDLQKKTPFVYVSLEDLLRQSDIVTLHVPYTPETRHLINRERLRLMKKGAYLINTSRGGLIDTLALLEALQEKHLGGAGLDVFEEEDATKNSSDFLLRGHPEKDTLTTILANRLLADMPNVMVTPHNAFNTREALERILDTTITNIQQFLAGAPVNLVE